MSIQRKMSVVPGIVMVATLAASPMADAAVNMYLKIPGMAGESTGTGHAGEIDVLAWSWGESASLNARTFNCVNAQELSVTKYVDLASPKLITALSTGQVISSVLLTMQRASAPTSDYISIAMTNVLVTSEATGGSGGEDRLTENVTFNFGTMTFTYTPAVGSAPPAATTSTTCSPPLGRIS